jgi:hypothetical protein
MVHPDTDDSKSSDAGRFIAVRRFVRSGTHLADPHIVRTAKLVRIDRGSNG